jgi:anti-anti-sigma factor
VPEFSVSRRSSGEVQIVSLTGDVDLRSADGFEQTIDAVSGDSAGPVVVDLSGVPFMDSIGLRLLIRARRRLEREERRLVIVAGQRPVRSVFELTRTDRQLDIVDTLEDAVRAANGA